MFADARRIPGDIYLVGGAVRDQLLGREVKERDWVVVGCSVDDMLAAGFKMVGADFPVFLHPESKEEYALARTERKTGRGYRGFTTDTRGVSLEDDLLRRDLTVNAMAQDAQGQLIDPHHGQRDLEQRVLRHVSAAFVEDPVRVLRAARFLAQLAAYEFRIADETLELMRRMVDDGELNALTGERVWLEIRKACRAHRPSLFFSALNDVGAWRVVAPTIAELMRHSPLHILDDAARQSDINGATGVLTTLAAVAATNDINIAPQLRSLGAPRTAFGPAEITFNVLRDSSLRGATLSAEDLLVILLRCKALRDETLLPALLQAWRLVPMTDLSRERQSELFQQFEVGQQALLNLNAAEITAGLSGAAAGDALRAAQLDALGKVLSKN